MARGANERAAAIELPPFPAGVPARNDAEEEEDVRALNNMIARAQVDRKTRMQRRITRRMDSVENMDVASFLASQRT